MRSKIFSLFSVVFLMLIFAANGSAQTSLNDLKTEHSAILKLWLATQKGWRLALEKDYDAERLRDFKTAEKTSPFYVASDFNGDKKEDFAVILTKNGKFAVAVFNEPFTSKNSATKTPVILKNPAFYSSPIERGDILYFPKGAKNLYVGPYESDAGFVLIPKGETYTAKSSM